MFVFKFLSYRYSYFQLALHSGCLRSYDVLLFAIFNHCNETHVVK